MAASSSSPAGRDLAAGMPLPELKSSGVVCGQVDGQPVILSVDEEGFHAVGGACTHYGAPLSEGLMVGSTVHCPWHHACFSLRTGEALAAPAFDPLPRWRVELEGDMVFVREPLPAEQKRLRPPVAEGPRRVLIVGGGAAGFAAAEMLRRSGYDRELTMLSADTAAPCDRPNLSKDYLAGAAPEAWIPLKDASFYADHEIDLRLGSDVIELDLEHRSAKLGNGDAVGFDAVLLCTGAEPVRLRSPGFDHTNVHVLRTLDDSRAIIAAAQQHARAVVIGASFIGLEAAASLRARGLEVHVVAPEAVPMERILGRGLGSYIHKLHERHGVLFHLGQSALGYANGLLTLSGGGSIETQLIVQGVGVQPCTGLAASAGLAVDRGVLVDRFLQTPHPAVYAAGDVARYPHPKTGQLIRVEHWAAAQRQGQAAALNILGMRQPFSATPFFWSNHYDTSIHYVGHAMNFDRVECDGSLEAGDATLRYYEADRLSAAATLGRDIESLRIELELESAVG